MLEIIPIPAFRDNYIWLLRNGRHAAVVDPGDAVPVLAALHTGGLQLDAILVTHHHHDHQDGIPQLLADYPATPVYAPAGEHYTFAHQAVAEDDDIELATLGIRLQVIETPGHTLGHVVYYGAGILLCGDTLFGCGCGRLREGDCRQMHRSLQRLAALPAETQVYCAHEYTLDNIRFALTLEPENTALQQRAAWVEQMMRQHQPSLPSTMGLELATNPFLRCDAPSPRVVDMMRRHNIGQINPETTFCFLRELKNSF